MARPATLIQLNSSESEQLVALIKAPQTQRRYADRARMILWAAEGKSNKHIAETLSVRTATVSKWRVRFESERLEGLLDDYRPGRPPKDSDGGAALREKMLLLLDESPPEGYAQWNGSLLAVRLGVKPDKVWSELRQLGISLQRRRSWCISTDPEFSAKAADIVGLYLDPPANAIVLSVDEKPCIQALERTQGWLKMPNGRALSGFAHEYKRHGTTNLFAALNTATGRIHGTCKPRKRREEFIGFLNHLVGEYPGQELHVVLDNLSVHKLKEDHPWRKKHPNVHFHFTPTHASWINQIEAWFSILSRSALKTASFTSKNELIQAVENFIQTYNETATPFNWTKVRVKQKTPQSKYANLNN